MKHKKVQYMIAAALLVLLGILAGCAGATLRTSLANEAEMTGTYTLILYGGRYGDDPETTAIFDREGDGITFEPYAPDFNYKIIKGVSAREGLEQAEKFISWHSSYNKSMLIRIADEKGAVLGYELRPLYLPYTYGTDDPLFISYDLRDTKVIVYIRLKPDVEQMRFGGGDSDRSH